MSRRRDVARFHSDTTSRQRDYSGGQPDSEVMSVTAQHTDGRYLCKRDHWPTSILVGVRPPGSSLPYPSRRTVYFEEGDRLRGFMLWTRPEREAWPVTLGGTPVITSNWICHLAGFSRQSNWTEADFDISTAGSRTGLGTFSLIRAESRENTSSPPSGRGDMTGAGTLSVSTQSLESSSSFLTSRTFSTLLSSAGVDYTSVTLKSLCRVGGYAYLHLETSLDVFDEETEETTTTYQVHAWKLNADWLTSSALSTIWYKLVATGMSTAPQTDLMVMTLDNPDYTEGGPNPQYLYRVLLFLWSGSDPDSGDQLLNLAILKDENGAFATSPAHPYSLDIPADSDSLDPVLSERISAQHSRVLMSGNWFYVSMAGQIHAFSVEQSGSVTVATAEWNTYTLGYHDSTGSSDEIGQIVSTCIHDGYIFAEFSNHVTYETITDLIRSVAKTNFGDVIPTPRTEPARGQSRRGGSILINATTGAQGGKVFYDDGTSVSIDTLYGPIVDTYTSFDPYVYTGPSAPSGAPDSSDFWLTGALDMHFARYHRYFWQEGVPDITGSSTSNVVWDEFPTRGDGDSLYSSVSYPAWNATVDASRDAKRAIEGANALALASARPNGTEQIRADRLRVEYPNWGERRVTGSPVSWEAGPTDTLTYDSVRGPTHPGGAGTPDITWELRGPNGREPYLPDYSADPPWPTEDFEEATSGYEVFGDEDDYFYRNGLGYCQPGDSFEWTFYREFIFRSSSGESWARTRNRCPRTIGLATVTPNGYFVVPPHSAQIGSSWIPLTWQCYKRIGTGLTLLWTYTHPGTGGANMAAAGNAIALSNGIYTFTRNGSTWRLIVLNEDTGELIDSIASPTNMLDCIFDGTRFTAPNNLRFGPA